MYESSCVPLMKELARLANIEHAACRKMVLVLDIEEPPRLFVETYMLSEKPALPETNLEAEVRKIDRPTTIMDIIPRGTHKCESTCMDKNSPTK